MKSKPNKLECLIAASSEPELVKEFDRLTGNNLSRNGSTIDLAIDDATGRTASAITDFIKFIDECIYQRI